jgi:hypothetical protein
MRFSLGVQKGVLKNYIVTVPLLPNSLYCISLNWIRKQKMRNFMQCFDNTMTLNIIKANYVLFFLRKTNRINKIKFC